MEINLSQNTPEWLEFRKNKIGASDSPIIMGVSPWTTPYQLWEEKLGLSKPREMTEAMQRGKDLEKRALQAFEEETGLVMFPKVIQHPINEWMIASFDGVDFDGKTFVEIKCPGKADHALALEGEIPRKYIPQLQHQMEVMHVTRGYYFSYDGINNACIEVKIDEVYIAKMLDLEKKFWECLQNFDPPELTDRDCIENNSDEWRYLVQDYKHCMQAIKSYETNAESAKKKLIEMAKGKNARGAGIKLMKMFRKGSIDTDKLAKAAGLDKEKFRKMPTNYWRIT